MSGGLPHGSGGHRLRLGLAGAVAAIVQRVHIARHRARGHRKDSRLVRVGSRPNHRVSIVLTVVVIPYGVLLIVDGRGRPVELLVLGSQELPPDDTFPMGEAEIRIQGEPIGTGSHGDVVVVVDAVGEGVVRALRTAEPDQPILPEPKSLSGRGAVRVSADIALGVHSTGLRLVGAGSRPCQRYGVPGRRRRGRHGGMRGEEGGAKKGWYSRNAGSVPKSFDLDHGIILFLLFGLFTLRSRPSWSSMRHRCSSCVPWSRANTASEPPGSVTPSRPRQPRLRRQPRFRARELSRWLQRGSPRGVP